MNSKFDCPDCGHIAKHPFRFRTTYISELKRFVRKTHLSHMNLGHIWLQSESSLSLRPLCI